jgi:hypothetical protein
MRSRTRVKESGHKQNAKDVPTGQTTLEAGAGRVKGLPLMSLSRLPLPPSISLYLPPPGAPVLGFPLLPLPDLLHYSPPPTLIAKQAL